MLPRVSVQHSTPDAAHDDDDKADLVNLIFDLARELRARAEEISGATPLTPAEATVMRHIAAEPGIHPAALAARTRMQRSNLSNTLNSLARKGFTDKRPSPSDARCIELFATELALRNMAAFRRARARLVRDAIGTATPDLDAAMEALRIIRDGLAGR